MIDTTDVGARITELLRRHIGKDVTLRPEDELFTSGLLNSLLALQLVVFVENTFEVAVDDDDLSLDNFHSIAAITEFVVRKRSASRA